MSSRNASRKPTAADVLARYSELYLDFDYKSHSGGPLTDVNQVGILGNRPITLAAYHGEIEAIEALIEGGADVNLTGDMGYTALHEAVEQGHTNVVKYLLDQGARTDIASEFGETAIGLAKKHERYDLLALLKEHKSSTPE